MENQLQQRSLAVDITDQELTYLIYNTGGPMETGSIAFDAGDDMKRRLEDAVYDNPVLLNDYSSTTVAVHSQRFALMPAAINDAALARQVLETSMASIDGEVLMCDIKNTDAAIVCDLPQGVTAFLQRTFANPVLLHHLAPLCAYCASAYADDNGCLHVNLSDKETHIVATRNGKLQMANTFQYRHLDDVVYFVLAVFKECRFDAQVDKVMLTGDNAQRTQLAEQLRQWIAYVMPEALPAQALKLGTDATTLPFNLLTLALY